MGAAELQDRRMLNLTDAGRAALTDPNPPQPKADLRVRLAAIMVSEEWTSLDSELESIPGLGDLPQRMSAAVLALLESVGLES